MPKKRNVLLRVSDLAHDAGESKKLRVQVTLYGLSAAVVEALADVSEHSRAHVVRVLVREAVRMRTIYEEVSR